jgi:hypothetical protein
MDKDDPMGLETPPLTPGGPLPTSRPQWLSDENVHTCTSPSLSSLNLPLVGEGRYLRSILPTFVISDRKRKTVGNERPSRFSFVAFALFVFHSKIVQGCQETSRFLTQKRKN